MSAGMHSLPDATFRASCVDRAVGTGMYSACTPCLRVAAATTVGDKGLERTEALIDAECDLIVIDTAHGHSKMVSAAVSAVKKLSNSVQVVAGNVATAEAARLAELEAIRAAAEAAYEEEAYAEEGEDEADAIDTDRDDEDTLPEDRPSKS